MVGPVSWEAMLKLGLEERVDFAELVAVLVGDGVGVGNSLHMCATERAIDPWVGSLAIPQSTSGFLCQDSGSLCRIIPLLSLEKQPIWRINRKIHGSEDTRATKSSRCRFQEGNCQERNGPQQLNISETHNAL